MQVKLSLCRVFTAVVYSIYLLRSVRLSGWVSFLSWSCRRWSPSRSPPAFSLHPDSCFSSFSSPSCRGHLHWITWWLLPRSSAARQTCSPDSLDVGPTGKDTARTQLTGRFAKIKTDPVNSRTMKHTSIFLNINFQCADIFIFTFTVYSHSNSCFQLTCRWKPCSLKALCSISLKTRQTHNLQTQIGKWSK